MRAFRLLDFSDRRSAQLLERGRAIAQELADRQLLITWQRKVRRNIDRRREQNPDFARVPP